MVILFWFLCIQSNFVHFLARFIMRCAGFCCGLHCTVFKGIRGQISTKIEIRPWTKVCTSFQRRRTTHAGNQGWKYYSWTSHDFSSLLSLPIHNMLTESSYILQLQSIKLNLFMRFGGKSKSTAAVIHFLHHHQDLKKRCQISSWNLMGTWMWGIVHQLWHDVDRDLMIIKWW